MDPRVAGVDAYVAEALRVLEGQQRVRFALGPMFTTLEGDLREIFEPILRMQEAVFAAGTQRVGTVLEADDRRDRAVHMEKKVAGVRGRLGWSGSDTGKRRCVRPGILRQAGCASIQPPATWTRTRALSILLHRPAAGPSARS